MKTTIPPDVQTDSLRQLVREGYAKIAQDTAAGCCSPGVSCCGSAPPDADKLARELGYTVEELKALPEGANMGLSCGNPAALAALKALDNVEFRLGEIEHLPVADNSVDAIISNCVINLSPDKAQVWREMSRVLKPGGRVAVSDMALIKPHPPEVLIMVEALVGCVAGAVLVSETGRMAKEAGLTDIVLKGKSDYIEAMLDFEDPLYKKIIGLLPAGAKASDYITSLEAQAVKPTSECCGSNCCEA